MRILQNGPRRALGIAIVAIICHAILATGAAASDAYLGITMSSLTPAMSRALKLDENVGVLVDKVVIGSPADKAGLLSGDVIIAIEDQTISGNRDLTRRLREFSPGDEMRLTIQREGKQRRLKATVGERPQRQVDGRGILPESNEIWRWFDGGSGDAQQSIKQHVSRFTCGFLGVNLDAAYPSPGQKPGALVSKVIAGSPAATAAIEVGDLIVACNGQDIADHAALQKYLDQTAPGDTIELTIVRDGQTMTINAKLAGIAERFGLQEFIQRLQARDADTLAPPPPDRPRAPRPPSLGQLEAERENLQELRQELQELKDQLRKLREELRHRQ